jgi:TRAP transporter TAXI family solute receptor
MPANTYNGQTADVATVAIQNFLVSHEGVSADTVYKMTKVDVREPRPDAVAAHAAAKAITRENAAKGRRLPLHPGAEKYYREVGLIK